MYTFWVTIKDFDNYSVSNFGDIVNDLTERLLRQSSTLQGAVKVNLIKDGVTYSRSVKVIVAEAYVDGKTDIFNTPINLDGDQKNNRADNILWRPRWFAWKYSRQFSNFTINHDRGPIYDLETGEVYKTFFEAALINGLLVKDIYSSVTSNKAVFPTWQQFSFVKVV